jgi:hypothetical protein
MSKFRFRRLEQYRTGGTSDRMELRIPLPKSETGKIHRQCPREECSPRVFQLGDTPEEQKIAEEQMALVRRSPHSPGTTCPYCGNDAPDTEFNTPEDIEAAQEYLRWAATEDIGDQLEDMVRGFNRRSGSKKGLISVSMKVKRPRNARPYAMRNDLLRDLTCDICGRRYGVYAIALFCPDCGARNTHVHFQREVELITQQIELARRVGEDGNQELSYRILGNSHEDVLTAFETYLKTLFRFLVKKRATSEVAEGLLKKISKVGNSFQNIQRGRELFGEIGIDPYGFLSEEDLNFLRLNIEKRHVIGHNLSMADEKYSELAEAEQPGQTVLLLADEVTRFADLCRQVIVHLEQDSPEFTPNKL